MFLTFHDINNPEYKVVISSDEIIAYLEYDDKVGGIIYLSDHSHSGLQFGVIETAEEFKKIMSKVVSTD